MDFIEPRDTLTLTTSSRAYFVEGVFHGALGTESVVELWPVNARTPSAYGKDVRIFVPLELIEAAHTAGFLRHSKPVNK